MLQISYSKKFLKGYSKLPENIRKKTDKQTVILLQDMFYPSLNTKKMGGSDVWEARVDKHYRFTFSKTEGSITFLTAGPHDEGLGKK